MNKNIRLLLVATIAASFSASADASTKSLVNASGSAVKNGYEECVIVANNEANSECGEVKAVAKKPEQAPKVEAPKFVDLGFSTDTHTLFEHNKSNLSSAGKAQIKNIAAQLTGAKKVSGLKSISSVKVVGYTDSRGSVAYNKRLSERRAATVRNLLVKEGVPASIVSSYGEGEANPIATNKTAEGRQKNRRVTITVTGVIVKRLK